ncbi:unnamed protein product [Linum trigynum]|uniref:Endonuclease/exonuclease/phosphatase domain-containing protein n=1 Tax=Linum trigynum TaxID=586398 RepID=A0AAV2CGD2_9ROSI
MVSSIFIWNVRGLGTEEKRDRIKYIVGRKNPKIVALIETKWSTCSIEQISSISGSRDVGWKAKDASGSSGGIAIYRDKNLYREVTNFIGSHFIAIEFEDIPGSKYWTLVVVYGPQNRTEKLRFMSEIEAFYRQLQNPFCLAGDFNLIRSHEDYIGADRNSDLMNKFNETIDNLAV